jgi:hypothetical protein
MSRTLKESRPGSGKAGALILGVLLLHAAQGRAAELPLGEICLPIPIDLGR